MRVFAGLATYADIIRGHFGNHGTACHSLRGNGTGENAGENNDEDCYGGSNLIICHKARFCETCRAIQNLTSF
jgi:hypothetical protein